jgi:tetratricopeptide (TPR) repeat protein
LILLLAALAAAAPPTAATCPDLLTPEALVCNALQSEKSGDHAGAAQAFEEAAKASPGKDPKTARMFAAAGNLWIAAKQPGKAALLDRARAAEAQNDLKTARAKLNEAAATISDDPFYWYFSAAVAIRENDPLTAQAAISKALTLAPSDPTILFEAGHVAEMAGDDAKARGYWMRAAAGDPDGEVGKAAAKAVEMLGVTPTVKMDSAPPK